MTVTIPRDAPPWAQTMVDDVNRDIEGVRGKSPRPFRLPVFTTTNLPDAATYVNCVACVSNGSSNQRIVVSDGAVWRYASGSAV